MPVSVNGQENRTSEVRALVRSGNDAREHNRSSTLRKKTNHAAQDIGYHGPSVEQLAQGLIAAGMFLHEVEDLVRKEYVTAALRSEGWNQSKAARVLGVHRNTIGRVIMELGIEMRRRR